MVRYLAERQVTTLEAVQDFQELDFHFDRERSQETALVFVKAPKM
jgi:cytoplasmic iron level regulating protein YaaA (DUF328/UPF0246 family)